MDVNSCDKLIEEIRVEVETLHRDHDWLLQVGVVHIMDKLIENPEFTSGIS